MYPLVAFALLVLVGLGHSSILTRIPAGTGPASSIDKTNNGGTNSKNDANRGGANRSGGQNCLREDLIQSASGLTGQETGTQGIKPGQAKSGTYVTQAFPLACDSSNQRTPETKIILLTSARVKNSPMESK